ncbi:Ldh family oxidoreductase [Halegenticoccus tardaugens]|uniref:Ldh family oxidoreductase n=1 Tax=Halegenticoccus tardaugens TaxID=2071624 RepID=UPI00100C24D4|nr:Ldh family oxidoreductase [Halegenticoccus tardaugens]
MRRIDAPELESLVRELVLSLDTSDRIAAEVAESLVESDLRGHGSHGSIRMGTLYLEMVRSGEIRPQATVEVERLSPTTAQVNGNFQYGQVVGRRAVDIGVELARDGGSAVVGVRNATHLGRIGEWAERAAAAEIGFAAFVNTGGTSPLVTIPGSAERLLSTNPLAFGIPTFDVLPHPVVLDMATSQVAHGKITKRSVEDRTIPKEWTVDESGEAITAARVFEEEGQGAMLPLGGLTTGYKGFGLAIIAELFAGVVADHRVSGQFDERSVNNGAMFVFVDPISFSTRKANRRRIEALVNLVHNADRSDAVPTGPSAKGDKMVLPGEIEYKKRHKRLEEGVPFRNEALKLLTEVARQLKVEDSIPDSFDV